jgi:4-amino-4-deoxy-L-arabinose transferase-like glycosyltransferase
MSKSRINVSSGYVQSASVKYTTLFFAVLAFHIIGTWSLPLIDRDEPRFAEASREMIERSDYIVPYFNNQFRFDKPPLAYWAQIASYKIFGENDFAARFPSAIAAALVAVSIFAWGSRIGGDRVGFWGAIIFTLSLQTFLHAKGAVADMWMVLFVTIAHWAGYELLRDAISDDGKRPTLNAQRPTSNAEAVEAAVLSRKSQWSWWFLFYLSLALGFLAKGPIAWTPLLTIGSTMFFARDLQLARRFKFVRGVLLMLAIVSLWGVPALIRTHGEFFTVGIGRHVIARSFGAMEGHGANSLGVYLTLLPFYFVTVFLSLFPWSIKLPSLVRRIWTNRDKADNYLVAGAAIIFIIFTLVKTKLPHYTLPALPLLSLLLARHLVGQERFLKRCAIGAACTYLAIAVIVPGLISGSLMVLPIITGSSPAHDLFEWSRYYLRPEMEFGAVDFEEPSLVWYFRSRVKTFLTPLNKKGGAKFMDEAGPRFVILPSALVDKVFSNQPSNWKTFSTHGFNIPKGKDVDLTLVLKPE